MSFRNRPVPSSLSRSSRQQPAADEQAERRSSRSGARRCRVPGRASRLIGVRDRLAVELAAPRARWPAGGGQQVVPGLSCGSRAAGHLARLREALTPAPRAPERASPPRAPRVWALGLHCGLYRQVWGGVSASRPSSMVRPMLSLYRRHRPRTFDEVVGQEHIVRTLRNAIELDKVHHAYLFVGSRGTGKTSMAKLLACALNAEGGPRADFDPEAPHGQGDHGGHLARRGRDGRGLEQLGRRHPRAARERGAGPDGGRQARLHPRRGAHALDRGLERVPEDARGAARRTWSSCSPPPRRTRCRPRSSTAATASTSSARRSSRSPACSSAWPPRRASRCPTRRSGCSRARPPAASATRSARSSSSSPTAARRSSSTTCSRSSASPTPSWCSRRPRRSPEHDPRAALLAVERLSELGARLHAVHARPLAPPAPPVRGPDARRGARLVLGHGRAHRPARRAGRAHRAGRDPARDRPARRRARRGQGRLRAAHPARAGAAEGDPAAGRPVAAGADVPDRAARGGGSRAAAAQERDRAARLAARSGGAAAASREPPPAAAVALDAQPEQPSQPVGAIELDQLVALWPAVADAVGEENGMLGAALERRAPDRRSRATGSRSPSRPTPPSCKKKAEANRELVAGAVRGLTGRALTLAFELSEHGRAGRRRALDRRRADRAAADEFGAEEVFEDEPDQEKR